MTKIYNGTPHDINIVKGAMLNPTDRKWYGGEVTLSIPSNGMLNARMAEKDGELFNEEIPTFFTTPVGVDDLPEGYDAYIVSALYAAAYLAAGKPGIERLYVVHCPVLNENGTFKGCRSIKRYL